MVTSTRQDVSATPSNFLTASSFSSTRQSLNYDDWTVILLQKRSSATVFCEAKILLECHEVHSLTWKINIFTATFLLRSLLATLSWIIRCMWPAPSWPYISNTHNKVNGLSTKEFLLEEYLLSGCSWDVKLV